MRPYDYIIQARETYPRLPRHSELYRYHNRAMLNQSQPILYNNLSVHRENFTINTKFYKVSPKDLN